jgi:hypothetical protein
MGISAVWVSWLTWVAASTVRKAWASRARVVQRCHPPFAGLGEHGVVPADGQDVADTTLDQVGTQLGVVTVDLVPGDPSHPGTGVERSLASGPVGSRAVTSR